MTFADVEPQSYTTVVSSILSKENPPIPTGKKTLTLSFIILCFFSVFARSLERITAVGIRAGNNAALALKERFAALGAILAGGLIPGHKLAVRIIAAAVEQIASFGLFADYITAADRAFCTRFFNKRLCELAFGVTRAGKELAEASGLYDHFGSALVADAFL